MYFYLNFIKWKVETFKRGVDRDIRSLLDETVHHIDVHVIKYLMHNEMTIILILISETTNYYKVSLSKNWKNLMYETILISRAFSHADIA